MSLARARVGGLYLHVKSNRLYRVTCVAICAENPQERRVVYQQQAASKLRGLPQILPKGTQWSRRERSFLYVDPHGVPRFQYLHERVER